MSRIGWNNVTAAPWRMSTASLALLVLLTSCNKAEKPASEQAAQKTFASPEEAGAVLVTAAKSGDQNALIAIFGPDSKGVLFTGDAVRDQDNLKGFIASYDQMHRWGNLKAGGTVLYTGADNFPFPIPLDKNSSGQWSFDTAAGKDEILARRIGRGELTAIAACGATAVAQGQYFSKAKQYAQQFASDQGKQNGLYWPVAEGQAQSPLGPLGPLGSKSELRASCPTRAFTAVPNAVLIMTRKVAEESSSPTSELRVVEALKNSARNSRRLLPFSGHCSADGFEMERSRFTWPGPSTIPVPLPPNVVPRRSVPMIGGVVKQHLLK